MMGRPEKRTESWKDLLFVMFLMVGVMAGIMGLLQLMNQEGPKPEKVTATSNSEYGVAFLFENEGCRVYRFNDRGWVYYVKCDHGSSTYRDTRTSHGGGSIDSVYTEER